MTVSRRCPAVITWRTHIHTFTPFNQETLSLLQMFAHFCQSEISLPDSFPFPFSQSKKKKSSSCKISQKVAPNLGGTGQSEDFRPSTIYSYDIDLAGCQSKIHHVAGQSQDSSSVVVARVWETHSRRHGFHPHSLYPTCRFI